MDARGNVTETNYGDGNTVTHRYNPVTGNLNTITRRGLLGSAQHYRASWDHLGNLVERKDNFSGDVPETFTYDEHNRLKSNKVGTKTVNMAYYLDDNIYKKSDEQNNSEYKYGKNNHAVTQIGQRKFTYDKNGNVTQDSGNGKVKTFTYTAKDQVASISLSTGHTTQFSYGTAGRFKRVDKDGSSRITTTLYVGNVEKVYNADNTIQYKRTVGGVAQLTYTVAAGKLGTADYKYLHKDHLGSINAITHGEGSQKGLVYQRMAFDPWGARRDLPAGKLSNKALTEASILASFAKTQWRELVTNCGFTGHEMLDEVGIIHMNGRIYDATIARFLQADPNVDGVTRVSGFNRYAYVGNNPLNATDPSGYFSLSKALKRAWNDVRPFVGAIVSAVLIVAFPGAGGIANGWFLSSWYGAATLGAISGAAGAAANGANLRGVISAAAFGAASGAAFFGVGQAFKEGVGVLGAYGAKTVGGFVGRALAHGAVGGVMSVLQGGKFGHGFAAAGIAKGFSLGAENLNANIYGQFTVAAIAGGTASEATGGKFANGAQSAALAFLVNQAASSTAGAVKEAIAQKGQKDFAWAKQQLSERGLVPDKVLNDPSALQDHTNKAAVLSTDGTFKIVDSWEAAGKLVSSGGWQHVEGSHSGGVMKIYMGATKPGFESYLGLNGMNLTGPKNLVQTIYHEYMHYSGATSHGNNPYSFEYKYWSRQEGKALGGWINDL